MMPNLETPLKNLQEKHFYAGVIQWNVMAMCMLSILIMKRCDDE